MSVENFVLPDADVMATQLAITQGTLDALERVDEAPLTTLGKFAVAGQLFSLHDVLSQGHDIHRQNGETTLHDSREVVAAFTPAQRALMEVSLAKHQFPQWLQYAGDFEGDKHLTTAITRTYADGSPVVSNQTLTNILEFHVDRMASEQRSFNAGLPERKAAFRLSMRGAIGKGYVPADVAAKFGTLDTINVLVDDGLMTVIHNAAGIVTGNPQDEKNIHVWHGLEDKRHTFEHEAVHIMSGADNSAEKLLGRIGDEALTEHITGVLAGGKFAMKRFSPPKTDENFNTYLEERSALWTLSTQGVKPVSLQLFSAAFFEDTATRERLGADSAYSRLKAALVKAFPFTNVMQVIKEADLVGDDDSEERKTAILTTCLDLEKKALDYNKLGSRLLRAIGSRGKNKTAQL